MGEARGVMVSDEGSAAGKRSQAGQTFDLGSIGYGAESISFDVTANQEKAKKMTISVRSEEHTSELQSHA